MTEEYGHISDAFDMLPEEELLMTEEEQKLYDVIADWWEDVFCAASYKGKDASLLDLVHAIMDLKYNNVPEDADPYNLRGRLPMQPVKKQQ